MNLRNRLTSINVNDANAHYMLVWRLYLCLWHVIFSVDLQLRSMDKEAVSQHSDMSRDTSPAGEPGGFTLQHSKAGLVLRVLKLAGSGAVSLFRFLINSGLFSSPGVVIVSSHDRATYGSVDLRRATTLVTLRRLNMVKHLEMFLTTLSGILPAGTNFVGCFSAAKNGTAAVKKHGREGVSAGRLSHPGRADFRSLNSRVVSEMLERNGLRLISMAEMNGVTCFHSRKIAGLN